MAEDNGMEEPRAIVTRLALLVERMGDRQEQADERFTAMAERWDGYIIEQRQINQEMRQINQRMQAILERLPPRGGANGGETAP